MTLFRILLFIILVSPVSAADLVWNNIGPGGGSDLHFLTVHPTNADIIYVSGDIEGTFKTIDGGQTWRNINGNLAHGKYGGDAYFTSDVVIDPANADRVYLCTSTGLFVSDTVGDQWTLLYPGAVATEDDPVSVSTVAVHPANEDHLFAGLGNGADGSEADFAPFSLFEGATGLLTSTDRGATWQTVPVGMTEGTGIHSIIINPLQPQQMFLATTSGIYRSSDGGSTWQPVNTGLPHTNCHRMVGRSIDGTFHLVLTVKVTGTAGNPASHSGGIFRSSNAGDTWSDITGNLPAYDADAELFYDFWQFDVHPSNPDIIYAATVRGSGYEAPGIYGTTNGGSTWTHLYTPAMGGWMDPDFFGDPYAFALKITPSQPDRIVISGDRVDLSDDAGVTWEQKYTDSVGGAWKGRGLELMNTDGIALDPANPQSYYVGYDDMGLFRTDDGGQSFFRLDPKQDPEIGPVTDADGVKDIVIDPSNGDLYISRWQGSQGGFNSNYSSGGVVFSADRGQTVEARTSGLPSGRADLIMVPNTGSPGQRKLFAAVFHNGVYRSLNGGQSWASVSNGLGADADKAWELAVDPTDTQKMYLGLNHRGSESAGLYRSTDGAQSWSLVSSFPGGDVMCVYVDGSGRVYASVTDSFDWSSAGGLYRSTDGGDTWTQINDHPRVVDVDTHPRETTKLLVTGQAWYRASGRDGEVMLSEDDGQTWEVLSSGVAHTFFNFGRFDARGETTRILAGTAGGGLWTTSLQPASTSGPLPGDFDGSGLVDFSDFLVFAGAFGTTSSGQDLDSSGTVDFGDFLIFASNFGKQSG